MVKSIRIIVLIATVFCVQQLFAQHDLRYTMVKGDTIKVEQMAKQLITMEVDGMKQVLTNDLGGVFEFVLLERNEQEFKCEARFVEFRLASGVEGQGALMEVDTTNEVKEDDMMGKIFQGLIDSPMILTMLPTGKVIDIQGVDKLIDNMFVNAGIEDEFTREMMKKGMAKQFGSESLSQSFEQMTFLYPESAKKVGESWENTFTGKLEAQNTWNLASYDSNSFEVNGDATIALLTQEEGVEMKLTGTQSTIGTFNSKDGFLISIEVNQEAKGISIMKSLNDMEVPTSITSVITYKRLQ